MFSLFHLSISCRSCVYFDDRSRVAGVAAKQKMLTKLSNTVTSIKHLIGRKFSDPIVQAERDWVPCEIVQLQNDGVGLKVCCVSLFSFIMFFHLIKVSYLNETRVFTPEQILAIIILKLKLITENHYVDVNMKVSDCVISVKLYFM
jgi:molecular chaperone DnaK (HSP70)